MTKKKKVVITKNKEIYNGLNRLYFNSEIILKNVKRSHIDRIVRNINKNEPCLDVESVGNYIIVKKLKPINFKVYLS